VDVHAEAAPRFAGERGVRVGHDGAEAGQEVWRWGSAGAFFPRGPGGHGLLGSALRLSLVALLVGATPGCSLVLTKGPEPELHPPPECTTSVAAPVTDTLLAATSVALAIAGLAGSSSSCSNTGGFNGCGIGKGTGEILGIAGAALGVLFAVSAGVGYGRTSACRASLGPDYVPPPTPPTPASESSLWPPTPSPGCPPQGDAPRVCALTRPSEVPWATGLGASRQ
jgi:hypothetical protein